MGKNLIAQRRGKGSSTFKAASFRYAGEVKHRNFPQKDVTTGIVKDIIHSRGHSAPLAKIRFEDDKDALIIAPEGLKVGEEVQVGVKADIRDGNTLALGSIPEGTLIYNIESNPGDGGKFVRSSGTFARVTGKTQAGITVLLPSKKQRTFNLKCRASIGMVAGSGRKEKPLLKAGTAHHKKHARGKPYPRTSATAMNAVDHPFGGSSSSRKGRPTQARRHAPAGAKAGMLKPRRSGRKKNK